MKLIDIKYNSDDWNKMKSSIGELIGLGRWGKGMIDELTDITRNLEQVESDIATYDSDRVISFRHINSRKKYQSLFQDFKVLHNFSGKVGDIVDRTIDQPFHEDLDAFVEAVRNANISTYTTDNHIKAVQTKTIYDEHGRQKTTIVPKTKISIEDLLSGPNFDWEHMKRVFDDWNELNPDQEFSYDACHLKELNSRAFEYQSIKDDQLNKEFWRDITTIGVFIVAGGVAFACPPVGVPLALSLGVVHGILEMGSAISGRDWISGRELSAGERWFRGALSPLDIIPGVAAVKRYSGSLKILNRLSNLGKTGKATPPGLNKVENIIQIAQKEATARIRKVGKAFKDAQRVFKEKTIEVAKLTDKGITKAKNMLSSRETVAVDQFGEVMVKSPVENTRYYENLARDRFNMPKAGDVGGKSSTPSTGGLKIINGKIDGKIPVKEYEKIRKISVKNAEGETLTLGRYNADGKSYISIAKESNSTYFDLGDDWGKIQKKYNLTNDDMFELFNIPVLDDAVASGKQIRFSHKPTIRAYEKSYLFKEWNYLKQKYGYTDLIKEGEIWYAVK